MAAGEFVHPEFRRATREGPFGLTPDPLSAFLEMEVLLNPLKRNEHPLSQLRHRVASEDVRRSDLFYLLMAYRIVNDDYARILANEGEFDRVVGIPRFTELCPKGERIISVRYKKGNGEEIETDSRGHFYLPRNHQANFEASYGRHWPPRKTAKSRQDEIDDLLRRGLPSSLVDLQEDGTIAKKIFREPLPRGPAKEFLTTVETPKNRDSLKEQREILDKQMESLVELIGPEWAEYDFVARPISGEDTYFSQRVLMEECEARIRPVEVERFRDLMSQIKGAGSLKKAEAIADEYLPPDEAVNVARFVQDASAESFSGPYSDKNKEFGAEDLHEKIRMFYLAVIASVRGEYFDEPLPEDLVTAATLVSEGEHLAAEGEKHKALEKFKVAMQTTSLSEARRKHFAEFCHANDFAGDASIFWSGLIAEKPK